MLIREARVGDAPVILEMIRELATYERAPDEVTATVDDLVATLFCESPSVFCHLVEVGGEVGGDAGGEGPTEVVGMAIWFLNYSTWLGKHGVYLEDLFIREQFRGRGYGLALLKFLAGVCVKRGYPRFQWWVLDWNTPAIEFYRANGAEPMSEWTVFRVSGEPLQSMAD
jgi:GNAT superfamily N-acetyltransferase